MQVGDLVTDPQGSEIGIIIRQADSADRWFVYWFGRGYEGGYNGCNLEAICK